MLLGGCSWVRNEIESVPLLDAVGFLSFLDVRKSEAPSRIYWYFFFLSLP